MKAAALDLDFRRVPAARWRWLAWGALAFAAALALWVGERHGRLQDQLATLEARSDTLTQRLRPARDRRPATPSPEAVKQIQRANGVIQRLTLPWENLFAAIDAADSRGLALLSIEPNAREQTLRVTGEVASVDGLLAYVDRLAQQTGLAQVHVVGFDTVTRDGAQVVAFTLSARWLP